MRAPQTLDLAPRELPPVPASEPTKIEARVAAAVETPDGMADRGEHSLHLVRAALVERELESRPPEPANASFSTA